MDIHIFHHFIGDARLNEILTIVKSIQKGEMKMTNEIETLTTQVALNTSAEASAVLLLTQLHDLLIAAQSDPTKLADLINQLAASKDALAAAIVANTV